MKKVIIGNCELYHGDCLEILPTLDQVDMIMTDPPYRLVSGGLTDTMMRGKFSPDVYDNKGSIVATPLDWSDFMVPIFRALKDGHAYFMANNRHVQAALNEGQRAGFRFHNILVWDKGTATMNRWYMKNCEYICFFFKGQGKAITDCGSKQLVKVPNVLNAAHPTQKPIELMELYIGNSTVPDETVLDPFMGSGTTGVACVRLDRRFIGIELDEEYFNLACERIQWAYDHHQPSLFEERI